MKIKILYNKDDIMFKKLKFKTLIKAEEIVNIFNTIFIDLNIFRKGMRGWERKGSHNAIVKLFVSCSSKAIINLFVPI